MIEEVEEIETTRSDLRNLRGVTILMAATAMSDQGEATSTMETVPGGTMTRMMKEESLLEDAREVEVETMIDVAEVIEIESATVTTEEIATEMTAAIATVTTAAIEIETTGETGIARETATIAATATVTTAATGIAGATSLSSN